MPTFNQQFLDTNGLTQYDGLIKNYINTKAASGYTPQLDTTNQALVFDIGSQPVLDQTNHIVIFNI